MASRLRARNERIGFRTTPAAERVVADRALFTLTDRDAVEWDGINARPARDLPGLRRLMARPSPFDE